MNSPIDCETARQHRDDYLRGRGPIDAIDAHLASCPNCLDAFLDDVLATPVDVTPPWGLATRVSARLPGVSRHARRTRAVVAISSLAGVATGAALMALGPTAANGSVISTDAPIRVAVVAVECVVLFCLLTSRSGVFGD